MAHLGLASSLDVNNVRSSADLNVSAVNSNTTAANIPTEAAAANARARQAGRLTEQTDCPWLFPAKPLSAACAGAVTSSTQLLSLAADIPVLIRLCC